MRYGVCISKAMTVPSCDKQLMCTCKRNIVRAHTGLQVVLWIYIHECTFFRCCEENTETMSRRDASSRFRNMISSPTTSVAKELLRVREALRKRTR